MSNLNLSEEEKQLIENKRKEDQLKLEKVKLDFDNAKIEAIKEEKQRAIAKEAEWKKQNEKAQEFWNQLVEAKLSKYYELKEDLMTKSFEPSVSVNDEQINLLKLDCKYHTVDLKDDIIGAKGKRLYFQLNGTDKKIFVRIHSVSQGWRSSNRGYKMFISGFDYDKDGKYAYTNVKSIHNKIQEYIEIETNRIERKNYVEQLNVDALNEAKKLFGSFGSVRSKETWKGQGRNQYKWEYISVQMKNGIEIQLTYSRNNKDKKLGFDLSSVEFHSFLNVGGNKYLDFEYDVNTVVKALSEIKSVSKKG